ncbi:hypothetical protein [Kitasatospora sp. NPDC008115]|uniref:hypothetical protein n=1 Tax=Kitasatospora sp. NPDC008115 TaxID=3364022 RepID=UPI0036EB53B5
MKFRTELRKVAGVHPVTGTPITRTEEVRTPVLPRDWDRTALRVAVGLVLALTLVSVVWSTVSIGALLKGGVGYAAASIFDVAWAVCLILEWMARYEPQKRSFPRGLGWGLLVCTMAAIGAHGVLMTHSIAAAVVGAGVSLFAKVLWLGVLQHIDRDLDADDQALVEAQKSRAYTTLALSSTRRQVARVEQYAALELLAMEQAGYALPEAAPVPEIVPPAPAQPEPARSRPTLERAVEAILADTAGGDSDVSDEAGEAIDAARADGWRVREIYDTARVQRRRSLDDLVSVYVAAGPRLRSGELTPDDVIERNRDRIARALGHGWTVDQIQAAVRAADPTAVQADEVPGHPDGTVSAQVTGPASGTGIRTGFEAPDPKAGRLSLAAAVEILMVQAGITDRDQLAGMLPTLVSAPFKPESLDREMRKHRT